MTAASRAGMHTKLAVVLASIGLAACGGSTLSAPPGSDKDSGTRDSGTKGGPDSGHHVSRDGGPPLVPEGGECELYEIISPVLTVLGSNGQPVCDATLVSADSPDESLEPCSGTSGCTGKCSYTVNDPGASSTFAVTVTAPGYLSATVSGLVNGGCGCQADCPAAQQNTVTLQPFQPLDAGPAPPPEDAGSTPCPGTAPTPGSSCSVADLWCEYGGDENPYCNSLFECESGVWAAMSTNGVCAVTATPCPAYSAISGGDVSCATQDQFCSYDAGTCVCSIGAGGAPPPPDAGATWQCLPTTQGCPGPVPTLGTPCTVDPSTVCSYEVCLGGPAMQCTNGYWALDTQIACFGG